MKSAITKTCILPLLADTINEYLALNYNIESVILCGTTVTLTQRRQPMFVVIMTKEVV